MKKIVLIAGCGRSGTHWLGNILKTSNECVVDIEKNPQFQLSINLALYNKEQDFTKLIACYRSRLTTITDKYTYVDKSHPILWSFEKLGSMFDNISMLAIDRNPYSVVSSSLIHKGILDRIYNWKTFPLPNRFLGITREIAQEYEKLPVEAKCSLKWLAHKLKIDSMQSKSNVLIIRYEDLISDNKNKLETIKKFIGLTNLPGIKIRKVSLDKWKRNLTMKQIDTISSVVSNSFYVSSMKTVFNV